MPVILPANIRVPTQRAVCCGNSCILLPPVYPLGALYVMGTLAIDPNATHCGTCVPSFRTTALAIYLHPYPPNQRGSLGVPRLPSLAIYISPNHTNHTEVHQAMAYCTSYTCCHQIWHKMSRLINQHSIRGYYCWHVP